ncbi:mannosyl-oligosaccharide 1,2-alpha-mannosidase IC [Lates japonicus]|uniref:Mannosyl-oligosaccharide 1,2-alpha-mannosidase IC n=1 Tax=Lates japonicus TaxID=270547 RepID=A0AAD3MF44_LATJO|nr:mannosyl-oligosaccharide 1,2-alpha-mannosidase IC [Lates japonicus]
MKPHILRSVGEGSEASLFEVNIRYVGGLLSACYLTGGDYFYHERCTEEAERKTETNGEESRREEAEKIGKREASKIGEEKK